jgi:hypothetical protein
MPDVLLREHTTAVWPTGIVEGHPFEVKTALQPIVKPRQNAGSVFHYWPLALVPGSFVTTASPPFPEAVTANWIRAATLRESGVRFVVNPIESPRSKELRTYLAMCARRNFIEPVVERLGVRIWQKLMLRVGGRLEVPDACPGPEGEVLFTWDRSSRHLELEITSDLRATLFYVDTKSNVSWECPVNANESLDERIAKALSAFEAPLSESSKAGPRGSSSAVRSSYQNPE